MALKKQQKHNVIIFQPEKLYDLIQIAIFSGEKIVFNHNIDP
jgi:hypothetical protein